MITVETPAASKPAPNVNLDFVKFRNFFAVSFLLVGLLWLGMGIFHSDKFAYRTLACGGVIALGLSAAVFFSKKTSPALLNVLLLAAMFNYSYVVTEGFFFLFSGFGFARQFYANYFNQPCSRFDRVRGFRWIGETCRCVRIKGRKVVIDQTFSINPQGYISNKSYSYKKENPEAFRYLVLGDSFTAGQYLNLPWPDRIEEVMAQMKTKKPYQFYSFGIDGGGLSNWHEIFFKEIIPNYKFDGIVIADFEDNLYRTFSVMHMNESGAYFGRFNVIPQGEEDFSKSYLPGMYKIAEIAGDPEINEKIQVHQKNQEVYKIPPPGLYLADFLHDVKKTSKERNLLGRPAVKISYQDLQAKLGADHFQKLKSMIDWCHTHQKEVILVAIPSREGAKRFNRGLLTLHQQELMLLAQRLGVRYWDGYAVFRGLSNKEIDQHWLLYDGHWNQKGSDRFASTLAQSIEDVSYPEGDAR